MDREIKIKLDNEVKFRYTFKRKSDGKLYQMIESIGGLEQGYGLIFDMFKNDLWDLIGRDRFTGLLDKKGKEIYEWDILKAENGLYVIEWDKGAFIRRSIYINTPDGKKQPIDPIYTLYDTIGIEFSEIVGNKVENPELLKGATN